MGINDIPVIGIGPGSQPPEEDGAQLEYIDLPTSMHKYQKPELPEPENVRHLNGAWEALDWILEGLGTYQVGDAPLIADLSTLDTENRSLVNQFLGEGEVSAKYADVFEARMQESILAGVWRTFYLDPNEKPIRDLVEIGDVPVLARLPGKSKQGVRLNLENLTAPPEAMNAPSIITELLEHAQNFQTGQAAHIVNLTLLPLSEEDTTFLEQVLGRGPITLLSRSYGDCQIISTTLPNVWWVRYLNSMDKLLLNTLEVVDMPVVACAALEDIRDSEKRLRDMLVQYKGSYPVT